MINLVVLDTNILRSLGAKFYAHIDYKSLEDYCYSSAGEIVMPKTVIFEYMDFYEREILDKNLNDIKRSYSKLKNLEEFKKIRPPKLESKKESQMEFIIDKLTSGKMTPEFDLSFKEELLVFFLLESKRETGKDNTRDFLIWLTTIILGMHHPEDRIVLISNDKIFNESPSFNKYREAYDVDNIEVFHSISGFLAKFGFQSNKLTEDLILASIDPEIIKSEILDDKDSIPSHISRFYYDSNKVFELLDFNLENIGIESFYSHKEESTGKIKVIAHVEAKVFMKYEAESNINDLKTFLDGLDKSKIGFNLETFDEEFHPIFDDTILFHFELIFDEKTEKIVEARFLDFFPDYPAMKKIKAHNKG